MKGGWNTRLQQNMAVAISCANWGINSTVTDTFMTASIEPSRQYGSLSQFHSCETHI